MSDRIIGKGLIFEYGSSWYHVRFKALSEIRENEKFENDELLNNFLPELKALDIENLLPFFGKTVVDKRLQITILESFLKDYKIIEHPELDIEIPIEFFHVEKVAEKMSKYENPKKGSTLLFFEYCENGYFKNKINTILTIYLYNNVNWASIQSIHLNSILDPIDSGILNLEYDHKNEATNIRKEIIEFISEDIEDFWDTIKQEKARFYLYEITSLKYIELLYDNFCFNSNISNFVI